MLCARPSTRTHQVLRTPGTFKIYDVFDFYEILPIMCLLCAHLFKHNIKALQQWVALYNLTKNPQSLKAKSIKFRAFSTKCHFKLPQQFHNWVTLASFVLFSKQTAVSRFKIASDLISFFGPKTTLFPKIFVMNPHSRISSPLISSSIDLTCTTSKEQN